MIYSIRTKTMPIWLTELNQLSMDEIQFPLSKILDGALYYPSAGLDGRLPQYLGGEFHSFIYVDYSITRKILDAELKSSGFKGYTLLARRKVTKRELAPNGWEPTPPDDGDPAKFSKWMAEPYCFWLVFQRKPDLDYIHGPERFSLLYLCADGVAAYQALYTANNIKPSAIAIIRPGHGFGGNWTNFYDPNKALALAVKSNHSGCPSILISEIETRNNLKSCWPEVYTSYRGQIHDWAGVGVWGR